MYLLEFYVVIQLKNKSQGLHKKIDCWKIAIYSQRLCYNPSLKYELNKLNKPICRTMIGLSLMQK